MRSSNCWPAKEFGEVVRSRPMPVLCLAVTFSARTLNRQDSVVYFFGGLQRCSSALLAAAWYSLVWRCMVSLLAFLHATRPSPTAHSSVLSAGPGTFLLCLTFYLHTPLTSVITRGCPKACRFRLNVDFLLSSAYIPNLVR